MIPAPFDYQAADSAEQAVALLAEHGDEAKILAGGHSLIPLMRYRLATPSVLVDVGRVPDLSYIRLDNGDIAIGALTHHSDLEHSDVLAQNCPMLAHVASLVGDSAVRHRGTIGGSLAHGDPAADLPAAVLALGGTLCGERGPGGDRMIAAGDCFSGYFETTLASDEMLVEVRIPVATGAWSYEKFHRRAQDWAIVGVAVANGGEAVSLVHMGPTPLQRGVEAAVAGGASAADAAALAADGLSPPEDLNADSEFRSHLARVLTERALNAAGVA